MLITFSGLDGSGKSTLIEWLKATLEQQQRPVAVFHMNDHIGMYAYLRAFRDRLLGASRRADGTPHRPPRSAYGRIRHAILWNRPLRRWIYPIDLAVFWCYRFYIERLRKRVLITDRYFYDTLVDVSDGRRWGWIRFLERLTPTPDVAVFLDVRPEEASHRKSEFPLTYLQHRWLAYQTVFLWVRSAVTVTNHDLSATKQTLRTIVLERVAAA